MKDITRPGDPIEKRLIDVLRKGAWQRTPHFAIALGMSPALAVTTAAQYGFALGLATTFVLIISATILAFVRHLIPRAVRIPVFAITVATFVTVADLIIAGFLPALHRVLGIYIPLVIVNCIILGRMATFGFQRQANKAFTDALGYGLGFTGALTFIGGLRELFAAGTLFGMGVMPPSFVPWSIMQTPAGAFIMMGMVIAAITAVKRRIKPDETAPPLQKGLQDMIEAEQSRPSA